MKIKPDSAAAPTGGSFESSLARLEVIARDLEEGELGLDAALARYQEGVACLRECRRMLEQTERKIELLMGVTDTGEAVTAPFDDGPAASESLTAPEKAASRSRRRSASPTAKKSPSASAASTAEPPTAAIGLGFEPAGNDDLASDSHLHARPSVGSSNAGKSPAESPLKPEVDVDSPKRLF